MAFRLGWSPEAIEDIESIAAHIARDSAWYAKAVTTKIVETAETIPDFPGIGRIVPEIGNTSIRERFVHSYRIIYRVEPEQILVAAVIHGRRLLEPFVERIEGDPMPIDLPRLRAHRRPEQTAEVLRMAAHRCCSPTRLPWRFRERSIIGH